MKIVTISLIPNQWLCFPENKVGPVQRGSWACISHMQLDMQLDMQVDMQVDMQLLMQLDMQLGLERQFVERQHCPQAY